MKKLFLVCATMGCFLSSVVFAQDFCCDSFDDCCPREKENFFNGLYVGGNIGAFSHTAHRHDRDALFVNSGGFSHNDTNLLLGVQLGYDFQCGNKLVGLLADWNWVNTRNRHHNLSGDVLHSDFDWFTTLRARMGLVACDALVYLTGGAVVSRIETRWANTTLDFRDEHTRWGWTGGVGTELMLTCNLSLGAEILFLHFSQHVRSFTVDGTTPTTFSFGHSDSAWVGRVLLNYRIGNLFSWF